MLSWKEILIRISLAIVIGGIIGWEREKANRPAGFRTLSLVSVGAAVVTITGYLSVYQFLGLSNFDPNRMAAQVISGIGFLGAGTILREGFSVRGLTTAASVWTVACLGIAAGAGYSLAAAIGTVIIFVVLRIFNSIEKRMHKNKHKDMVLEFSCKNITKILVALSKMIPESKGTIQDIVMEKQEGKMLFVVLKIKFYIPIAEREYNNIYEEIQEVEGIENVENIVPF